MQQYDVVIWSSVSLGVLSALVAEADGRLPVQLGYEDTNPADVEAVMVIISTYTLTRLIGCEPVTVGTDESRPTAGYWRLGYVRRADQGKANLHQLLKTQERPLDAFLIWDKERKTYQAVIRRISVSDDDDEIPY